MEAQSGGECGLHTTRGSPPLPRCPNPQNRRAAAVVAPPSMEGELGAFLFSAVWVMARARVVVANSGSNIGTLLMTLAQFRTAWPATPHLVDMDRVLSPKHLQFRLRFLCSVAFGNSGGVCGPLEPPTAASSHAPELIHAFLEGRRPRVGHFNWTVELSRQKDKWAGKERPRAAGNHESFTELRPGKPWAPHLRLAEPHCAHDEKWLCACVATNTSFELLTTGDNARPFAAPLGLADEISALVSRGLPLLPGWDAVVAPNPQCGSPSTAPEPC